MTPGTDLLRSQASSEAEEAPRNSREVRPTVHCLFSQRPFLHPCRNSQDPQGLRTSHPPSGNHPRGNQRQRNQQDLHSPRSSAPPVSTLQPRAITPGKTPQLLPGNHPPGKLNLHERRSSRTTKRPLPFITGKRRRKTFLQPSTETLRPFQSTRSRLPNTSPTYGSRARRFPRLGKSPFQVLRYLQEWSLT